MPDEDNPASKAFSLPSISPRLNDVLDQLNGDAARGATLNNCHRRVRNLIYNLDFIATLEQQEKYLHPLVVSFDFRNLEIKLREIIEDYANER